MPQQPFTSAGVQQKVSELYLLNQNDLQAQADLISNDIVTWLNDNFTLNQSQRTYLSQMDQRFIDQASNQTAFAIGNRLEVTLTFQGAGQTKLVHKGGTIEITASLTGFNVTGSLDYIIEYQ